MNNDPDFDPHFDPQRDPQRRFGGVARLYGDAAYARIARAKVVVVGLGGVGSWAAEALARCGVGALALIDLDHVAESNTNRQIQALGDTYGKAKVVAMAERIHAINPACEVEAIEEFVTGDNVAALIPPAGIVIDCIDDVRGKAALVAHCRARHQPIIVCGGAGGRVDPARIRRDDLARAQGDALLAKLRARLRRDHGFPRGRIEPASRQPKFGVPAVFTDEPLRDPAGKCDPAARLACAGFGSSVMVTASLGFAAAAATIEMLILDLGVSH
jgi:tRNA A37 threonylcarbamoyladenosine dehydratase